MFVGSMTLNPDGLKPDDLRELRKKLTTMNQVLKNSIAHVDQELQHQESRNVDAYVTDHAIVRYLERVKNLNREEIEKLVVPTAVWGKIYGGQDGTFDCGTHRIKVVDKTVVTVLPK